jgi:uncharacterized protein (TIRG00374 family)
LSLAVEKKNPRLGATSKVLVKLSVSTGLMIFLLSKISLSEIKSLLTTLNAGYLFAGVVTFFTSNLIGSYQWHTLLKSSGIDLPYHKTLRFYFVGLFFNNFLPANVGGDAVKIYDVSKIGGSVYQVIAVTLLDRIVGIFGLCLLALVAAIFLINSGAEEVHWYYIVVFIGCMIPALGLYLFKPFSSLLRRIVRMIRPLSLDERISSILDYLGKFKEKKPLLLNLMMLSLVIQALRVSTHILIGLSLGIHVDVRVAGLFFVFVPLLGLAMIPPITINGLGVREGLGIILFSAAGIGQADAFTMEFLTYIVSVAVSLLGFLFFISRRADRQKGVL